MSYAMSDGEFKDYLDENWRDLQDTNGIYTGLDFTGTPIVDTVDPDEVLPLRKMSTDKDEATRGGKSYDEHLLLAKTTNLLPGYKDKQYFAGEQKTNAPALTDAATATSLQMTASNEGWDLQQGDVDSVFPNGRYLDPNRGVFSRAPKGGLPALPEHGWASGAIGWE